MTQRLNAPSEAARKRGEALVAFFQHVPVLVTAAHYREYLALRNVRRYRLFEIPGCPDLLCYLPPAKMHVLSDAAAHRPVYTRWHIFPLPWWAARIRARAMRQLTPDHTI